MSDKALDRSALLAHRAKRLAAPAQGVEQPADSPGRHESVMIFRLGADRFALPLAGLLQVLPRTKLATVPGSPPEVAGLIQIRGEVRPVYHVRLLLELTPGPVDSHGAVLLLRHEGGEFGILVDAVEEVRAVPENMRRPGTPARGHAGWMTEDLVPVLSVGLLLGEE